MSSDTTVSSTNISAKFTHALADIPHMSTETAKPSYTSIYHFLDKLLENASSVPYPATNLGHIALVLTDLEYIAINGTAFVPPPDPGPTATIPTQAAGVNPTGHVISQAHRDHTILTRIYNTYIDTKQLLRNIIINKVDDKYINALKHRITKYNNIDPITIITHLKTNYGRIQLSDKTANSKKMATPWNPPTPIENLWSQLREGQDFAQEGNEPISDATLARNGYELILATGLFTTSCKTWRLRPEATQTFSELQIYFNGEIDDYESNSPTSGSQGFANSAENIQNMIHNELQTIFTQHNPDIFNPDQENLPPAAPAPEPAPAPTQGSANSSEVLSELKNLVNALTSQSNINNNNNNNNNKYNNDRRNGNRYQGRRNGRRDGGNQQQSGNQKLPAQGLDDKGMPVTYCWSHGTTSNLRHNSMTCMYKKDGHQDASTYSNKMGGCATRAGLHS